MTVPALTRVVPAGLGVLVAGCIVVGCGSGASAGGTATGAGTAPAGEQGAAAIVAALDAAGAPCTDVTYAGAGTPIEQAACTFNGTPIRIFVPQGTHEQLAVDISGCRYAEADGRSGVYEAQEPHQAWTVDAETAADAAELATVLHGTAPGREACK